MILDLASRVPHALHLEIGQPDFPTPAHIVAAARDAAHAGWTGYTPNAGLPSLREAIADKVQKENGIPTSCDNVVVTVGGMGGLFATFAALLNTGDEVLLPDPGYPNYMQMVDLCQARSTRYPLDPKSGFQPSIEALAARVTPQTKAIVVNSPSNPTGAIISADTMRAVLEVCRSNDLYLVSDECYEKITFGARHVSPGVFDTDGRVVSVFSFSKTYAMTGWRVGYVVARPEIASLIAKLNEATVACAPSISQKAAEAALGGPQECVRQMAESYRERRDLALAHLQRHGLPWYVPQGAFYLLVDIQGCRMDSQQFAEALLREEAVAVAPGRTFGPVASSFVRVSLAASPDRLETGMEKLCTFILRRSG